jgi:hypothetical protein
MSINNLSIPLILSIAGTSLSLSGWILMCLSFTYKVSNFTQNPLILIPPNAFLITFLGALMFSLSDLYDSKWLPFAIQILVSILNFSIYIVQRKTYRQRLEDEIR